MRNFIFLLVLVTPIWLFGQVGITYTLANGTITQDANYKYFEFDIMAQASANGTRIGTGIVFLTYNAAAFGSDIYDEDNQTTDGVDVTNATLTPAPFYNFLLNNTQANVLAITHEYPLSAGYGGQVTTTAQSLEHVKMRISDTSQAIQVCFWPSMESPLWNIVMANQQYYDNNSTTYSPVYASMCLYQDPPLPVELSYFSCAMNTANSAVNLTWVSQTETGMVGYRIYRGDTNVLEQAADQEVLIEATNTSQSTIYFFSDTNIESDHLYHYWLEALDLDGSSQFFGPTSITTPGQAYYAPNIPLDTGLTSIYPNPFNPDLTIQYTLDQAKDVQIYVSNIRGQIVRQLVTETKDRGVHQLIWDGRDNNGNACSSGVFYIRMIVGGKDYTRKAILLK